LVGRVLEASGKAPDLVLSSTAVRALGTARLAAAAGDWNCPIREVPQLYGASVEDVAEQLRQLDDQFHRVLVAGHEPTSSTLVHHFTGALVHFPTAALARIKLSAASWKRIQGGDGTLSWLLTPKLIAHLAGC
jgi:phosphohistidine phosphatase